MPTVYITAPTEAASTLAHGLVEARLAACVNVIDCESVYWWGDEIETEDEVILLAKTTDDRYEDLVEWLEVEHPYNVPCIERFDESHVFDPYGDWVEEMVETAESGSN